MKDILIVIFVLYCGYTGINKFFPGTFNSKLENYIMCHSAAEKIGEYKTMQELEYQTGKYIIEEKIRLESLELLRIKEKVENETLKLHTMDPYTKYEKLIDVYNSSTCQKLHSQGKTK